MKLGRIGAIARIEFYKRKIVVIWRWQLVKGKTYVHFFFKLQKLVEKRNSFPIKKMKDERETFALHSQCFKIRLDL